MLRIKATSRMLRCAVPRLAYSTQSISSQTPPSKVASDLETDDTGPSVCPGGLLTNNNHKKPREKPISNPTLKNLDKRWEDMPPQEQANLWMALRDRMRCDWSELTFEEKKAAWFMSFGPHGPRTVPRRGEYLEHFWHTIFVVILATAIVFFIRLFARPPPKTMTKEWQEMSNEYLRKQNSNPIYGISSEGYTGKGMIQSPPKQD